MMLRSLALMPLLVTLFACCFAPGGGGPSPPPPPSHPLFDALQQHLALGAIWGETVEDQQLAESVQSSLSPYDGVVVRIVPGAPRHTVVLVRFDDHNDIGLADMDDAERRARLTMIASVIDGLGTDIGDLVIAMRGNVLYGARYRRRGGAAPEYDVGFMVDAESWVEEALTPAAAPMITTVTPPAGAAP